ncbi:ATP synthase F1 subunit epsilon [Acidaminobacter sp. JC074]|uniref:ATP synthase F1 subunit epsilon n=1 Tax=Acidaminobacter sp. JC074 TaxID=2530199 RepID=UPI001F10D03E|nr:ATP synthase F1 subunit epsilon [Acidaminobacter sp. JC074]MCH4889332.1 ATP synthase F1 subunit epsilon [Acidaminobacter sp. JC074]
MRTYLLEIVTPDKNFFEGEVEMAIVRTTEGDIGILKDHEPVVAPVSVGAIRVKIDGEFRDAACSGGFLTIDSERVIVITDSAEWADEIDVNRAKDSADRAAKRLEDPYDDLDILRAKVSMERAMNRIRLSGKSMDHSNL